MSTKHPSKRHRTSSPPKPDEGRNRYLDTLSYDISGIVLRHLSWRPQHENWHAYVPADWVNNVLDVRGVLGRAALMEFNSIEDMNGIGISPVTALDLSISLPLAYRLPLRRLVLEFREEESLPDLIRGCGAELRKLVLDTANSVMTEKSILAISTHCTKLSSLAIRGWRMESTLTPIWRSLGSTLTRIYIGRYDCALGQNAISVPDLVEHCVNLSRVDVERMDDETADILVALGRRIRVLDIEKPLFDSPPLWDKLYEACTNLEALHLAVSGTDAIDTLSLMRAKSLCIVWTCRS